MSPHTARRRGLSLTELLICLVIVVMTTALLLPALLSARGISREQRCRDNMQQLGIALASYHSLAEQFPPGAIWPGQQYADPRMPCLPWLFPHLGHEELYSAINWSVDGNIWCDDSNAEVVAAPIPDLLCPADGLGGLTKANPFCGTQTATNYMAFYGDAIADVYSGDAPFGANYGASLDQITDGAAHTLLIGEYLTGTIYDLRGQLWADEAGASLLFTGLPPNSPQRDRLYPNPRIWNEINPAVNDAARNLQFTYGDGNFSDTAASRSRHPGGVHALTADGSVHFVSEQIDPAVWSSMGNIRDGGPATLTAGHLR